MSAELSGRRPTKKPDGEPSQGTGEAASWSATYTYKADGFTFTDQASIRDVSPTGCSIRGRTPLAVGTKTTVTFYLPDQQRPLKVTGKVVGATGEVFEVKFPRLGNNAYQRLRQYMQQIVDDPHASGQKPPSAKKRRKTGLGLPVSLLVVGALWGCGTLSVPVSDLSAPFFTPTSEERVNLAKRASELEVFAKECAAESTCNEHMHFSRALLSLYENRDAARASFQKVISLNPSSVLANCSALWLHVLDDNHPLAASYRPLLRDLTGQWLHQRMSSRVPSSQERTLEVAKPALVQALRQQVRERDRHIAHLRGQLDALRVINQDQDERRRMRPPASLLPKLGTGR